MYEWNQARHRVAARKREAAFQSWLDALSAKPPDVLVGANFAAYGGIRHHIQAIQRYSSLNVALAPPESVLRTVGAHQLQREFRERFLDFPATGIKVVHSHVFPWFIEWCRERQKQGMRWVHTYHNHYFPEFGRNGQLEHWQAEINDALLNVACHADLKLSVSKWQRDQLLNEHGIETVYLPNGVDVAACDGADAAQFTRRTGLKDFILYVGRNQPVKNPAEFLRLARHLQELSFVMIGNGLNEQDLRADWQMDIPSNLTILGALAHEDVLDAIAACSALVITSKREGLPTLAMEAMAQSKPVVVPDEAGCMEVVGKGEAGLIYEASNIESLAKQTIRAMTNKSMGEIARRKVLAEYDWRVVCAELDSTYQSLIDTNSRFSLSVDRI